MRNVLLLGACTRPFTRSLAGRDGVEGGGGTLDHIH